MSDVTKTASIYTRISSDKRKGTEDEGAGVDRQEAACRTWAAEHGYTITQVYSDNDISASSDKLRPGFEALLQDRPAVVIVWHNDRLLRKSARTLEQVLDTGFLVHALRAGDFDLSTPTGRALARTVTAWAQQEVEHKAERQVAANLQRATQGKRPSGGRRSFGYTSKMVVVEDEAHAVAQGYQWVIEGVSLKEVARRWNAAGLGTPQSTHQGLQGRWTGDSVRRCLRKPVYVGMLRYRGEDYGLGSWTAIVTMESWTEVQSILADPTRKPVHGAQKLLSGVALCGVCEGAHTVHAGGGRTGLGVYSCSGGVKHLTRRRDHIDAFVRGHVIARLSRRDVLRMFASNAAADGRRTVTTRMTEIDATLDDLAGLLVAGVLTKRGVETAAAALRAEREQLATQLHASAPGLAQAHKLASAPDVETAWDALATEVQRQIIDALMVVTIDSPKRGARSFDPATVRIEWR